MFSSRAYHHTTMGGSVQNGSESEDNLPVDANSILIQRFMLIGGALLRSFSVYGRIQPTCS